MPQAPRELDPSQSPRALFGYHLRQLRDERDLSQAALGGRVFVSGDAVATWEKGRSLPDQDTVCMLDEVLTGRGLLLATWRLAAARSHADIDADSSSDAISNGRPAAIMKSDTARGPEATLLAAAQDAADFAAWAERINAGEVTITSLAIRVRELANACLIVSPNEAATHASALSREVFDLLRGHHKPSHARDLYAIAAQTCALLAWLSGDIGAVDAAMLQGTAAQVCADHADMPEVSAWVAVVRSKTAFWQGDFRTAAQLARNGATFSPPGTASVMLACQEADAYSKLGAVDLASEAPGRHANYSSGVYLLTGRPDLALAEADRALAEFEIDPNYGFGTIGQVHATRTLAFVAGGDIDGAAEAVRPVLDLPRERRLATLKDRLRLVAAVLGRHSMRNSSVAGPLRAEIIEYCGASSAQRQLTASNTIREDGS